MAKFPLTLSGTTTINPDNSITVAWTIKDGNLVQFSSPTATFPAGTNPADILIDVLQAAKEAVRQMLTPADLPPTFSFQFSPRDLV